MKNITGEKIFFFVLGVMAISMLSLLVYEIRDRHVNYETHFEEVVRVIINKESEQESINRLGQFRTNYYLLLDDGELKDVDLKNYMSLNIGDTISWTESYQTRK